MSKLNRLIVGTFGLAMIVSMLASESVVKAKGTAAFIVSIAAILFSGMVMAAIIYKKKEE